MSRPKEPCHYCEGDGANSDDEDCDACNGTGLLYALDERRDFTPDERKAIRHHLAGES